MVAKERDLFVYNYYAFGVYYSCSNIGVHTKHEIRMRAHTGDYSVDSEASLSKQNARDEHRESLLKLLEEQQVHICSVCTLVVREDVLCNF